MNSTSELSSFAARLRRFIRAATNAPERPPADAPIFDRLALELFALQFEQNAPYRRFCGTRNVRPDTVAHWTAIPAVPTMAFKELELSCLPVEERTTVFCSSGTTGHQPSRHFHNAQSLALYEASLMQWFSAHFQLAAGDVRSLDSSGTQIRSSGARTILSASRASAGRKRTRLSALREIQDAPAGDCQLAIFTPPPAQAPHSSLVHMFETIRRQLAPGKRPFVGKPAADGAWALEQEAALELLRKAAAAEQPLLMLGTAFSFVHLLDCLADQDLRLELPPGSCALETGGYKGRSRALPKTALHALLSQRLGIPAGHIVCEYGMSELGSQAYDRAVGPSHATLHAPRPFHFPPWARVQVISPETGCEVGEGETGLIRVFDLANVYSVMAIQTEDLGIRCGDGFELAGRAASAEPRGCSLLAV
jgi:hypothetical protein